MTCHCGLIKAQGCNMSATTTGLVDRQSATPWPGRNRSSGKLTPATAGWPQTRAGIFRIAWFSMGTNVPSRPQGTNESIVSADHTGIIRRGIYRFHASYSGGFELPENRAVERMTAAVLSSSDQRGKLAGSLKNTRSSCSYHCESCCGG